MKLERLDKIIASQTSLSRKQVASLIKQGELTVDGEVVLSADAKADPEKSKIIFCSKPLEYSKHIYIMMNKPKGVLSASTDKKAKTVVDLLPDELRRRGLFPAGRLDKYTTGFILLTDDGDFAHKILSPKNHIEKTYVASLEKPIAERDIKTLENGIELSDGTKFKECRIRPLDKTCRVIEISICEGKFHQIKRMLEFVDNKVLDLDRIRMGALALDPALESGQYRLITAEEKKLISDFDE